MEKKFETKQTQEGKSFQWFFFVVLIPFLFAIIVALVICFFAGINVFSAAKGLGQKLPIIGSLEGNSSSKQKTASESDLINLQGQVKDRDAQIEALQNQLDNKGMDIQQAKLENQRLQQQIDDLNANKKASTNASNLAFKDIIKTYTTMTPKNAAAIITNMNDPEAVKILGGLKADALAAIMEKMDPKNAAKYTQLLANEIATK